MVKRLIERRQPIDRRGLSALALRCQEECRNAGVVFHGIQPGFHNIPSLMLFSQNQNSTCLALAADVVTAGLIRAKLNMTEAHVKFLTAAARGAFVSTSPAVQPA